MQNITKTEDAFVYVVLLFKISFVARFGCRHYDKSCHVFHPPVFAVPSSFPDFTHKYRDDGKSRRWLKLHYSVIALYIRKR